jgi:ribosomal-protein-alanine N-acetyltransferase
MGLVVLMHHIAERIAELELELFDNAFNEHTIRKEIDKGWGFAYEVDGKYVGYVLVRTVGKLSDIVRLGVQQEHRRKGIAKELLEAVLEGDGPFMLFVRKNNTAAIELYKKYGFTIAGMSDESWVMRRTTSSS